MHTHSKTAKRAEPKLVGEWLSVGALLRNFRGAIGVTWLLTLCETAMTALVPLFMGFAIDGLLANDPSSLLTFGVLVGGLIVVGVVRRVFDTRAYGTIRVALGLELAARANGRSISKTNARIGMGRELADFLEERIPELLSSFVQLGVALVILWSFHPALFASSLGAGILTLLIYAAAHQHFFHLNGDLNHQMEQQVEVLSVGSPRGIWIHLTRLRKAEIRISDTEAVVYGAMFMALLGFIVFNLWFAAGTTDITVGRMVTIVLYSWEFLDSALILPTTFQGWTRLSEITSRINSAESTRRNKFGRLRILKIAHFGL